MSKDFSDLEKEREAEALNDIRYEPSEKMKQMMRDIKDMSTSLQPYWKQQEYLKRQAFIRYCNSHPELTEEQIRT